MYRKFYSLHRQKGLAIKTKRVVYEQCINSLTPFIFNSYHFDRTVPIPFIKNDQTIVASAVECSIYLEKRLTIVIHIKL